MKSRTSERIQISSYVILIVIVFFVAWYIAADYVVKNSLILPDPLSVAKALVALPSVSALNGDLRASTIAVAGGFVLGAGLGLLVGFVIGISEVGEKIIKPYINFFMSTPKSIFLPLFIFAFGLGIQERIYFGAVHAFFIMAANTAIGVATVDPNLLKLSRFLQCSKLQITSKIIFPSALPMILTGARYAFLLDFLGVLLAEMYITSQGIGSLLTIFSQNLEISSMLAVVAIISIIAITINQIFIFFEQKMSTWRPIRV